MGRQAGGRRARREVPKFPQLGLPGSPTPGELLIQSDRRSSVQDLVELKEKQIEEATLEKAMELLTDPITGSKAKNKEVLGIVQIHVDDVFITAGPRFKSIVDRLERDFKAGTEDHNDVMFVGQRVQWVNRKTPQACIQVDQERKVEELAEILFDKSLQDIVTCTPR